MNNDLPIVGNLFEEKGIKFSFSNLKNLASSEITYPQFLACVAQRILLKQYAAQAMDPKNFLCPMSRTSEVFNKNKGTFSAGIDGLFLKPMTLSVINSQTSKNKVTKEEQATAAVEFVKWYSKYWFSMLKSEEFLYKLEELFKDSEMPNIEGIEGDWNILKKLYDSVNDKVLFNITDIDSQIFINRADNIDPKWFSTVLSSVKKFMEMAGKIDIESFKEFVSDEDLIVPTTSSFMISTLYGIEEIEDRKKRYNAPLDPYDMFYTFKGTSMSHLLKMNQFTFTLYNYFKILL